MIRPVAPELPHALALWDHWRSGRPAFYRIRFGRGPVHLDSTRHAFGCRPDLARVEAAALDACRGRVLDVGAGAGRHALALQDAGLEVEALDVSPVCAQLLRERGVERVHCRDLFSFAPTAGRRFDTVLALGHGLGLAGSLVRLPHLLARVEGLLAPDGALIADSYDGPAPSRLAAALRGPRPGPRRPGRGEPTYPGETRLRVSYRTVEGGPFDWLWVDPATLGRVAGETGWTCEVIARSPRTDYVARLRPGRRRA